MLDTRNTIALEIEQLTTAPLLIVQTSPPEGTYVPAGPRNIGVRGLVPPGAKVTLNGKTFCTLWMPPFTLDVTDALKAGKNNIAVRVTSTTEGRPKMEGAVHLKARLVETIK